MDYRFDFDAFVKQHNVEGGSYGMAELEQDRRTLAELDEEQRKKRSA